MSLPKAWLFVLPAVLWIAALFVVPLILMACYSLWSFEGGRVIADWTSENYKAFFARDYLVGALFVSIEVATFTTIVSLILGYALAYILAYHVSPRWQWLGLLVAVLPFWTSYLVRSYSWLLVLSEGGVLNSGLLSLGLLEYPISIAHSRAATIVGFSHFFGMLFALTVFANLRQIRPTYRLAAADLGASGVQTFLRVTLPLSIPGVAVGAFLTFVIAIGDYITPTILGGGKELLLAQAIMLQIGRHGNFPMAAALSMILMAVVSLAFLGLARWMRMSRV